VLIARSLRSVGCATSMPLKTHPFVSRAQGALTYRAKAGAAAMQSEIAVRKLRPIDPTLSKVVRAMRAPAPNEADWVSSIEAVRRDFETSTDRLRIELPEGGAAYWRNAIAQSHDPDPPILYEDHLSRALGEVTRAGSKSEEWGRFFYRIVSALRPERCLELGTSVGMSGCYIAAALTCGGFGHLITIEGQASSAEVARHAFATAGVVDRVDIRIGQFVDQTPAALAELGGVDLAFIDGHHQYQPTIDYFRTIMDSASPGGLLVFDDVDYPFGDMARAWREIQQHARVTSALTIATVGLAVIDGGSAAFYAGIPQLPHTRHGSRRH